MLHLRAHIFDHDVGGAREAHERFVPGRVFQVQPDRALVAMQVLEVEAVAVAGDVLALRRRFDADHVGAPVGQVTHAGRPGAGQGQVEHGQAVQRQAGFGQCGAVLRAFGHAGVSSGGADCPPRPVFVQWGMDVADLALVFAVDGSASVTYDEFNLIAGGIGAGIARSGGHSRADLRAGEDQHARCLICGPVSAHRM